MSDDDRQGDDPQEVTLNELLMALDERLRDNAGQIKLLRQQVNESESELDALKAAPRPDKARRRNTYKTLYCNECTAFLTLYDTALDVVRIRHRDMFIRVHAGENGWVSINCRGCGAVNTLRDDG